MERSSNILNELFVFLLKNLRHEETVINIDVYPTIFSCNSYF